MNKPEYCTELNPSGYDAAEMTLTQWMSDAAPTLRRFGIANSAESENETRPLDLNREADTAYARCSWKRRIRATGTTNPAVLADFVASEREIRRYSPILA